MRVLLTGATGFIGSHVARLLLSEGHRVFAVVRPESERWRIQDIEARLDMISGDLDRVQEMAKALDRAEPDVCIHLAWRGWWKMTRSAEVNLESLRASVAFAQAVLQRGCPRLVIAGTCFEYEIGPEPVTEDTPVGPDDLYTASKHALHLVAEQLARMAGASLAWVRIFQTYGPFDDVHRLLPSVIRALLRGEAAPITAGEQVRDYLHVEDVASGIWAVARSSVAGSVDIASGIPVTVRTLAEAAATLVGRPEGLRIGALPYRAGEPMVMRVSGRKLREVVGWSPRYDLDTGLAHTVAWWHGEGRTRWQR